VAADACGTCACGAAGGPVCLRATVDPANLLSRATRPTRVPTSGGECGLHDALTAGEHAGRGAARWVGCMPGQRDVGAAGCAAGMCWRNNGPTRELG